MAKGKLSERQARFVTEYIKDGNAMQAALRAGYSPNFAKANSSKLLEKVGIKEALQRHRKRVEERSEVTAAQICRDMYELYKTCAIRVPKTDYEGEPELDENGNQVFEFVDANIALASLDKIMKHLGGYSADNKREIDGEIVFTWGAPEDKEDK